MDGQELEFWAGEAKKISEARAHQIN